MRDQQLLDALPPDAVDVFEDELARRLGLARHPGLDEKAWRRQRVEFIEGAGERGDELGRELEAELLG